MSTHNAILIIGPTGSGKTPLGELLVFQGLRNQRCFHFDFGQNLRHVNTDTLNPEELAVIARSLETGSLLEDEHFPIARKILLTFLNERNIGKDDIVILNGLPRHAGQAEGIDSILNVQAVVYLSCSPEIVYKRIHSNASGDRAERIDDDIESIKRKLDIFAERTAPLLKHYRQRGAKIETIEIIATTTAKDIWERLNAV
ncbi:MAG: nucleoside monophosphate kinase [Phycisphaerae bacterium]|nr:nucleoside monophosphate kinase [Phycisphaerae bacterium]